MDKEKLKLFGNAIQQICKAQEILCSKENVSKNELREASFELGTAVGMLHSIELEEMKNNNMVDELEEGD